MRIQFLMVPLLLLTFGCADKGPPLVKVEGTVNLDGVPLPFKNIMFHQVHFKITVDGISQQYTFSIGSWQ